MDDRINQEGKKAVWRLWEQLDALNEEDAFVGIQDDVHPELVFWGPDPIDRLFGVEAFLDGFWRPLKRSFPDLRRETFIFMGGRSNGRIDGDIAKDGRWWASGTGVLHGTFRNDYLGIRANGKAISIRWGEFCRMVDGQVCEIFCLLDYVDLFEQLGLSVLPRSRGKAGLYPPPRAYDGVLHASQDARLSAQTLAHIRHFIFDGLNRYDKNELKSMGMADFFHPDVRWYGPGGIGACLGFIEFEDLHQRPWLVAFPDRRVQDLDALIAEGAYSGAPGWAGVIATHSGSYLGCSATHRKVEINGLDWWKRDGEHYIENWVFVDMIHLFRQFGVDLFERFKDMQRT